MTQKKNLTIAPKNKDILLYESDVWASADILRSSVGLKGSEFPDFMMPFFALRMVESRLIRKYNEVLLDTELTNEQDRIDEIKESVGFYNRMVIEDGLTLASITMNDKTFHSDFRAYLDAFDPDMKALLGIASPDKTENLNLMVVVDSLHKKQTLLGYTSSWARIDFTPYDNSEITTLEEHIKRKWADMSAETAGEQYTPDDIIRLIAELIATDEFKKGKIYKLYDMTCGGGNMLYGVEDKIRKIYEGVRTATYGQELRGSLYALSKIESMFRPISKIVHGNTLTDDKLGNEEMDYGVANPPYGVSWKEEYQTILSDLTGRFGHGGYPSSSDAQLLFVQHMIAKLNETGKAFIVLNGSPLFSGDAGSGESGIRKWILDNDYLEALIQLPTGEFFNTSITTYIWCLNMNKSENRKDKILCINAEGKGTRLKKTKGVKTQEITVDAAKKIAEVYSEFKNTDCSKVVSKFDFYFNKQSIKKLEKDDEFGAFMNGTDSLILKEIKKIEIVDRLDEKSAIDVLSMFDVINNETAKSMNDIFKSFDNEIQSLSLTLEDGNIYSIDENNCIIKSNSNDIINLGYGTISLKSSFSKATAKKEESISIAATLESVWIKDEEKIGYSDHDNTLAINEFLTQWVAEDLNDIEILNNQVGVEINFNSVFPKEITIRKTIDILKEIQDLGI